MSDLPFRLSSHLFSSLHLQRNVLSPPISKCHDVPRIVRRKWWRGCIAVVPTWVRNRVSRSGRVCCCFLRSGVEWSELCFDQFTTYAVAACPVKHCSSINDEASLHYASVYLCKFEPKKSSARTHIYMKQRVCFTFPTNIRFTESHCPARCILEQSCSWESQTERGTQCSAAFKLQAHFLFLSVFVRRSAAPVVFRFCFLHSINACNHLLVINAQIYCSFLFLFCFVRVVSVSFSFILPVYTATEFGRRLGFAMPHLFVAVVNRTEPDLSK